MKKVVLFLTLISGATLMHAAATMKINLSKLAAQQKLFEAARIGRIQPFKQLLAAPGVDVNATDRNGMTALMWAGNKDIVAMLLEEGADVNATDMNGWTALMRAAQKGDADMIRLLLRAGADVNAANKLGSALHFAAKNDRGKEAVKLLLQEGADKNLKNEDGLTAEQLATQAAFEMLKIQEGGAAERYQEIAEIIRES